MAQENRFLTVGRFRDPLLKWRFRYRRPARFRHSDRGVHRGAVNRYDRGCGRFQFRRPASTSNAYDEPDKPFDLLGVALGECKQAERDVRVR